MRDWLVGEICWYLDDAALSVCGTQYRQYAVNAGVAVGGVRHYLMIMAWRDSEGWLNIVVLGNSRVED